LSDLPLFNQEAKLKKKSIRKSRGYKKCTFAALPEKISFINNNSLLLLSISSVFQSNSLLKKN
jgi:hypothetical protein